MAFSYITYTANGTAQWAFNFDYIVEEELVVSLDGSVVPATDYSVTPDGIGEFITFNVAPSVGVAIKIQRETDLSEPVVTYSSGSALLASSLNLSNEQVLNASQEVKDISQDAMTDVGNLATDLEAEEQARINADNVLQDNINDEATARQQGDSGLQQGVDALDTQLNSTDIAIGDQAHVGHYGVSIGIKAGGDSIPAAGTESVAIGHAAGGHPDNPTGDATVSVGAVAGNYNQQQGAVAVGYSAGSVSQGANSVAVGPNAGSQNLGFQSVSIGSSSAATGGNAIAIGASASASQSNSIQLGDNSQAMTLQVGNQVVDLVNPPTDPQVDQNKDDIANLDQALTTEIGDRASGDQNLQGQINNLPTTQDLSNETQARTTADQNLQNQIDNLPPGGTDPADQTQIQANTDQLNAANVAIGQDAASDAGSVSIGLNAGSDGTVGASENSVSIGNGAGGHPNDPTVSGTTSVGFAAGNYNQQANAVAVGYEAGSVSQGQYSVAIGGQAGDQNQGIASVAVGLEAGQNAQGIQSVAVGLRAGQTGQADNTVAIGCQSSQNGIGFGSVSVGALSKADGANTVSIGSNAGLLGSGSNSILIGANVSDQFAANDEALIIGHDAGQDQFAKTGTQCTVVGHNAHAYGPNSVAIGYGAVAAANAVQLGSASEKLILKVGDATMSPTYISPINPVDIPIGLTVFEQAGAGWLNNTGTPMGVSGTWSGCFAATTAVAAGPVQEVVLFEFGVSTVSNPDPTTGWDPTPGVAPCTSQGLTVALLSGIGLAPGFQWPAVTQVPFGDITVPAGQYLLARVRSMDANVDNGWVLCGQTSTAASFGPVPVVRNLTIERMYTN